LCLGGRVLKEKEAKKIADVFLKTDFLKEARHKRRIRKMEC
jgi:ribose 5-phosphate isomerase RpiB